MKNLYVILSTLVMIPVIVFSQTVMVQGVLRDPAGRTVANGTHAVTFTLYDAATGGSSVWSETHGSITTEHGVFSVELGTVNAMSSLSFTDDYWVGIAVDGGTEISQRMRLINSPSANAVKGATNSFPSTGNVGVGTTSPGSLLELNSASPYIKFSDTDGGSVWNLGNYGTERFILYEDAAGTPTERFVVKEGGNVGIGTTNPLFPLHVNGSGYLAGRLQLMRTSGPNYIDFHDGNNLVVRSMDTTSSGAQDIMTVEPGGNVGIGTTTPSEKLDVAGNLKLSAGGALIFPDNTSLTSASLGGSASSLSTPGNAVITADADAAGTGDVQLKTGNNTQMVVTNNGLVGIGTTTPDTKVTISDAAPYIKFNDTEGGNAWQLGSYGGFRFLLSEVYAGGSSERLSVAEGGNVGINNGSPDAMLSIDANGNGDLINTHTSHTTNAKIFQVLQNNSDGMVKVNDANGNTSVQLDGYSGGTSFILSKLGIGTASPQDALQINGGALLKDRLRLMRTSGPNYIDFNNNQDLIFRSIDTTDANAATRMIIQTDGKIGFGTTAPTEFLDLTSSLPYMRYTDTDGGSAWTIGNYGGNRFLFNEVTSTATHERLSLAEGGNIGINNTAPDAKLSVDADSDGDLINAHTSHASNAKIFQVYQSGNDGYLRLNDGNGNNIAQIAGYSQGSSWFNSQYVGIGTSTPAAKLDIEDTNDPVLRMGRADGTYWDQVVTGANSWYYKLRNNGNTYFEMHGDGSGWMQGSLAQNSDQRLKRNIRTIDSAVEKITRLRGVKYQWRGDEFPNRHFDNNFHLGFIAQEIESVFPELVQEGSDGYKSVIYNGITPVLVEAVKEQQREIEELKGQNQTLQETLQQIQAQLNQLTEGSGNY